MQNIFIIATLLFFFTFAGTAAFRFYAIRVNLVDVPNHRSSHHRPTPRGAGIVFVVLFIVAILTSGSASGFPGNSHQILFGFCCIAMLGSLDDKLDLPAAIRLLTQIALATWIVFWAGGIGFVQIIGTFGLNAGWLADSLAVIGLVWLLNLFNFMDGIDLIACAEAIFVSIAGALFLVAGGNTELAIWSCLLASSLLGFMIWNLPPARVFMGDAGSLFLGVFIGSIALISHTSGEVPIWVWLILLAVFIVDATVTLVRRLLLRKNAFHAHRDHAYQHIAVRTGSHKTVVLGMSTVNLFWLLPLSYIAYQHSAFGFIVFVVAYAPLVILAVCFDAGLPGTDKS